MSKQQVKILSQIALNAESEGFDSLWVFESLLWPLKPQLQYLIG
jgi:hypothetical protein